MALICCNFFESYLKDTYKHAAIVKIWLIVGKSTAFCSKWVRIKNALRHPPGNAPKANLTISSAANSHTNPLKTAPNDEIPVYGRTLIARGQMLIAPRDAHQFHSPTILRAAVRLPRSVPRLRCWVRLGGRSVSSGRRAVATSKFGRPWGVLPGPAVRFYGAGIGNC